MLGFIGGTGLYDLPGLRNTRHERVESPFGGPSDDVLLGELDGQPLAFLPRHGRGHVVPPTSSTTARTSMSLSASASPTSFR